MGIKKAFCNIAEGFFNCSGYENRTRITCVRGMCPNR